MITYRRSTSTLIQKNRVATWCFLTCRYSSAPSRRRCSATAKSSHMADFWRSERQLLVTILTRNVHKLSTTDVLSSPVVQLCDELLSRESLTHHVVDITFQTVIRVELTDVQQALHIKKLQLLPSTQLQLSVKYL